MPVYGLPLGMTTSDLPPTSNPAGRLWHIVRTAKKHPHENMQAGIAAIFGLKEPSVASSLRGAAQILDLISEVERWMRRVPGINAQKHLSWVEASKTPFVNIGIIGISTAQLFAPFDEPALSLLSICSDHLEAHFREPQADDAAVKKLLDEAIALFRQVANSDLEPAAREYILRHLQIVVDALFDFRTKGFEALWNGASSCTGHERVAEVRIGIDLDSIRKTPMWQRTSAIILALGALIQGAQNAEWVLQKGENMVIRLLPASPDAPRQSESVGSGVESSPPTDARPR